MPFHFPPEIEYEIFRIVVCTPPYVPTDAHLALVSKRVQSVIEPMLYETIVLAGGDRGRDYDWECINMIIKTTHENDFTLALHSKPPSFFKKHVTNLFVLSTVSEKFFWDVLSICNDVKHLAAYNFQVQEYGLWNLITAMPLRSLEFADFQSILDQLTQSPHTFSQLNYLSVVHTELDKVLITNSNAMKYFPELTHFAVRIIGCTAIVNQNLKIVLDNFPRLQSLMVFIDQYRYWGNELFDSEIRKWMELDKRVEVIDSPLLFPAIWKERVTTGRHDFEGCRFKGRPWKDYRREWDQYWAMESQRDDEESDDDDY